MVEVEGIIATSHRISAYGGVYLADSVLEEMADALRSGRLPMLAQHDLRRPMDAVVLEACVRKRSDGYKEVWARFCVDEERWATLDADRIAAGAPGGFSFSCSEPLVVLEPLDPVAPVRPISISADASHWSDDDILTAAESLRPVGPVNVGRRYEFAQDPGCVVALGVVASVAIGVASNAIYDALKRFLRPGKPTIFHFHVEEGDRLIDARLETDDVNVLQNAVAAFEQVVASPKVVVWDDEDGRWKPM
jgi:hypothetical protein